MEKIRINLYEILTALSNALDLVSPEVVNHHQQVAYLAFRLAEMKELPEAEQRNIFLAGLVHDIGAISRSERLEIKESEPLNIHNHSFKGAKLLAGFKPLQNITDLIKFHHVPWNHGNGQAYNGEPVPYASHVIHLADRVCARFHPDQDVLAQVPVHLEAIRKDTDTIFEPGLIDALMELSQKEYIWLDTFSRSPVNTILNTSLSDTVALDIDDIVDLAFVFSNIIDFRSRFTACHSAGVACTAEALASLYDFSSIECKMMMIAGYFHDLGKIAIDQDILEKPARLNVYEFNKMRSHSYYTYHLLSAIPQFRNIREWASYHHEKLDGTGYPFHIKGENLSLGSRIMAVADIFTAITENRPYREGMDDDSAAAVLHKMVENGAIDGNVVGILMKHFRSINADRENAQKEALKRYESFLDTIG